MSTPSPDPRPTFASFWHDLPREGKLMLSVVVFEFLGTGLVLPFHVVYLHEVRHFSLTDVGIMLAILPVAGLVVTGPGGTAIDRVGARPMMVLNLLVAIAGDVILAFATTKPVVVTGLLLLGMAFGLGWPVAQTLISSVVPASIRARYFGINFSLLNLGIGIGGIVGGLWVDVHDLFTFQAIYLADAVSFLPSLVLMLGPLRGVGGRTEIPADHEDAGVGYLQLLRRPAVAPLCVIGFVGSLVGYSQLNIGLPAFARAISHVSTGVIGFAFAANTAVIVLIQLVVLRFIEGNRRTRVLAVMAVIWAFSWVLLGTSGLIPDTWGAALLLGACTSVFAFGETLLQPSYPPIVNELAPDHLRGRYNALTAWTFQVGAVVAPVMAGVLIGHGHAGAFIAAIVVGSLMLAVLSVGWLEAQLPARVNGIHDPDPAEVPTPPGPGPGPLPVAAHDTATPELS